MKKFALLGSSLSHSYSKIIHEKFYKKYNIDAQYELINTKSEELESLVGKLKTGEYNGFNVTIPFKEEILKYVDVVSPGINDTGVCNTLICINNKIYAYNSDICGFDYLLNFYKIHCEEAYILGTGATSKTVRNIFDKKQIKYKVIGRNNKVLNYEYINKNINNELIVNTTPIGMYPNIEESILTKEVASKASCIIDLIYNPAKTKLMSYNTSSFNGLTMLVYQAAISFEVWTKVKVELDFIEEIIKELEVK